MGRARSKAKSRPKARVKPGGGPGPAVPVARALAATPRWVWLLELVGGGVLVLAGFAIAALAFDSASASNSKLVVAYGPVLAGLGLAAHAAIKLAPDTDATLPPRPDTRRWIYGGLAVLFAIIQAICLWKVIPNRLPGAFVHLVSFPLLTGVMAIGTLAGGKYGWWTAVLAGTGVIVSTTLVIVRILISAAFLAGVYGAFGKAAATFSFVAVALIVQAVALLPIVQLKWLMTRAGRRAYGV